ncbi:UDP-glucose 4-epimerase GalE [Demequina gelatinilytica]|uniref:UDP-glucose 4-epimerase GalE n=1 Tax=Demequina gelatinilytica TaxID=1638980 RepID=UPI000786257B|nr:UDP-glucose 4-epimerase GalE [Demequina gelatinilytica]
MSWLVTGGAGYIGSHVVRSLSEAGIAPVVVDDLSSGVEAFVPADVPFLHASILETEALERFMAEHGVVGVIHCAGYKYAGESVKFPLVNYKANVDGTRSLLEAMENAGVRRLVFSSSAGVYGNSGVAVVTETTPTVPESPYGRSKLIGEWLIADQVTATSMAGDPLAATSLRYFNVVGSGYPDIYDASPHNLFPKVFFAIESGKAPQINGTDYSTPDGTCVRDYVHVSDLAAAHVVAAQRLDAGDTLEPIYNLGSGSGTSVRQIVDAMVAATGTDKTPVEGPRRPGDPDLIVADGTLATRDLGWGMRHTVQEMVDSAWAAHPKA